MSLTKPFINTINAFDATIGTTAPYLSVLGGDAITSYTYEVYNDIAFDALPYSRTTVNVQNDVNNGEIRNFPMPISPQYALVNNENYFIKAYTSNADGDSAVVLSTPFNCYITPSIITQWDNRGTYQNLADGIQFNAPQIRLSIKFETNDANSVARLNWAQVNVYGVQADGVSVDSVYSSGLVYNEPASVVITNLLNTQNGTNSLYSRYTISVSGETIDGFALSYTYSNITSEYDEYASSDSFYATNLCDGRIKISHRIPSVYEQFLSGTFVESERDYIYWVNDGNKNFSRKNKNTGDYTTVGPRVQYEFKVTSDADYIYQIGLDTAYNRGAINKLDKDAFTVSSSTYTASVTPTSVCSAGEWIYIASGNSITRVNKTTGSQSMSYSAGFNIASIDTNGTYVFCAGENSKVRYFNIAQLAFETNTLTAPFLDSAQVTAIKCDGNYTYLGSANGEFAILNVAGATFESIQTPFSNLMQISSISVDLDSVCCATNSTVFAIYDKANLAFGASLIAPFPNSATVINWVASDGLYFYLISNYGCMVYNKVSQSFGALISPPWETSDYVREWISDGTTIYMGLNSGKLCTYSINDGTFGPVTGYAFGSASTITDLTKVGGKVYISNTADQFIDYDIESATFGTAITVPQFGEISAMCSDSTNVLYMLNNSGAATSYNITDGQFANLGSTQNTSPSKLLYTPEFLYGVYSDKINIFNFETSTWTRYSVVGGTDATQDDTFIYIANGSNLHSFNKNSKTVATIYSESYANILSVSNSDTNVYFTTIWGLGIYNKNSGAYSIKTQTPYRYDPESVSGRAVLCLYSNENVYCLGELSTEPTASILAVYNPNKDSFIIDTVVEVDKLLDDGSWAQMANNIMYSNFDIFDTFVANGNSYTYRVLISGIQSASLNASVLCQFNGVYICDANTIYGITNEYELDSVETVQKVAIYEPYGAKYPTVAYNAETLYRKGATTAVLLAPTSNTTISASIDRKAQVRLLSEFNSWLANKRAKVLKDFNGNMRLIAISESSSNGYYKDLGNGIASTTFQWVEIGDFSTESLSKLGVINSFKVIYE